MNTAKKIFSNTFYQIFGRGVTSIISILVVKFLTFYLGVSLYGEYNTIYQFLASFSVLADLGIYIIAVREMSKNEDNVENIFGNILFLRIILSTLFVALVVIVAYLIPQYSDTYIPQGILISGIGAIFALINGVIISIFQVKLKMQYSAFGLIIQKIIYFLGLLFIGFYFLPIDSKILDSNWGLAFNSILIAGVISNLIMLFYSTYYANKLIKINIQFNKKLLKDIIIESLPYGIALVLSTIYLKMDVIMLSIIRTSQEVGIYSVATKVIEILNTLPVLFLASVLPVLTRLIKKVEKEKINRLLSESFNFIYVMALPIFIGLFVLSYQIVYLMATPDFLSRLNEGFFGSDYALKLLSVSLIFTYLASLFSYILIAVGQQKQLLYINLVAVIFNFIFNIILINLYGFIGAGITTIISNIIILCMSLYVARKYLKFSFNIIKLMKITLSSFVMGMFVLYMHNQNQFFITYGTKFIFVIIGISALIYGGMLFLLKAITKEDINLILK